MIISPQRRFPLFMFFRIGGQLNQLIHQMRNHTISTKGMILIIYILNNLPIAYRKVSLRDICFISLVESVPEQCHHRHADGFIVRGIVLQLLCLPSVLPCDDSNHQHTYLLNPVFLYCLSDHFQVQRHPFLHILYLNPCASAVVIRNALNPCSAIAVPYRTLNPCSSIVVPYSSLHVSYCHGNAGYSSIVAGISA